MAIRASWMRTAAVVLAAVAVIGLAAAESQAMIMYDTDWLGIDSLTMKIGSPIAFGKESFIIRGTFNLQPNSIESTAADLTFTVGSWAVNFPPSSWTSKGLGKPCKAKSVDGNITVSVQYWINGTSKCKYTIAAKNQDLRSYVMYAEDWAVVPVRLQIGTAFDESVSADCWKKGPRIWSGCMLPQPHCIVDKVQVRNVPAAGGDAVVIKGRLNLHQFDGDVTGVIIRACGQTAQILPGEWSMHGKTATVKKTFDTTKKLAFSVGVSSDKLTITLSKLDLSPVSTPLGISIQVSGGANDGYWAFAVWPKANGKGTVYTY